MNTNATAWSLQVKPYELPLLRPVVTSQVRAVVRRGWHLRLGLPAVAQRNAARAVGLGELAPWPGFGSGEATLAEVLPRLPTLVPMAVAAHEDATLAPLAVAAELTQKVAAHLGGAMPPELQWALELACLDLLAKLRGRPLAQLLCEAPRAQVQVHAQVSSAVAASLARDDGFAAFKVKVGSRALDDEGAHVAAVRVAAGEAAALRLDANGAWSRRQALSAMRMFAAQAPDWVEQPLAAEDVAGMAELVQEAIMPVAVDEGASSVANLAAHLRANAANVVVLKPAFVGGIAATLAAAELARSHGARVCLTHAFESQVGCLGVLHLAAALRLHDACGLLPALVEAQVTPALVPFSGQLTLGQDPGLGWTTDPFDAP